MVYELIPVTISDDGTVRKADLGSKWYSYEEKIWANAVILKDETKDYKATEVIPEENIESYFVWIPKYRYKLWDLGLYDSLTSIDTNKVHEIPVIFGDYNTSDNIEGECTTPMESGASGNCNVGDYMTHPAFLSNPSKGFWVGKFETGYDGAATSDDAKVNVNDPSKIIIKPNVYSWRRIKIANAFYSSYDYKRNLDSHMMKNTEWGAVAYLQHSKYGSGTSVRINNNSSFLTGYQANNEPTCGDTRSFLPDAECSKNCLDNTCNKAYPNSNLASSTNNISGIFDMSGGSLEYMMAFVIDDNNNIIVGSNSSQFSGFNGNLMNGDKITNGLKLPSSKYYDMYHFEIDNAQAFNYRILGDATGEGGPFSKVNHIENHYVYSGSWYNDSSYSWFTTQYNFFQRSAAYYSGYNAGVFATTVYYGSEIWDCSFRLILTPT